MPSLRGGGGGGPGVAPLTRVPQVEIVECRRFEKNTLRGFLKLRLPAAGITIKDCTLHEKNGDKWVGLPSRSYQQDGQTKYARIFDFDSREARDAFQAAALRAVAANDFAEGANS